MRVPSWAPFLVLASLVLAPAVLGAEPARALALPREAPLASDLAAALHGLGSTPRAPHGTFHVMVVPFDGPPVTAGPVPFGVLVPFDADARTDTGLAGIDLLAGVVPLAPDGSAIVGDGELHAALGAPLALVVILPTEEDAPLPPPARRFGVFASFEHPTLLAWASLAVDARLDGLPNEMVLAFPSDAAAGLVAPVAPLAEARGAAAAVERAAGDAGVPPAGVVADAAMEAAKEAEAAARAQAEDTLGPMVSFAAELREWAENYASDVIAPAGPLVDGIVRASEDAISSLPLPPLAADARPPSVSAAVPSVPWNGRLALDWSARDVPGQVTVFGVLGESGENARSLATSAYFDPLPAEGLIAFAMSEDATVELRSAAPALLSVYAFGQFPFPYASSTLSILAEDTGTSFYARAADDEVRISNLDGSAFARVERVRFDDALAFRAWIDGAGATGTITAAGIDGKNELAATIEPGVMANLRLASEGDGVSIESGHVTEGRSDGPSLAFTGVPSARSLEVGAGSQSVSLAFPGGGGALAWFRSLSGDPLATLSVEGAPADSRVALRVLPGGVPAIDVAAPSAIRDVAGRLDRGGFDQVQVDASIHVVDAPGQGIEFANGPGTLRARSLGAPWGSLAIVGPFVVDAAQEISRDETWMHVGYPVAFAKGSIETSLAATAPAARFLSVGATRVELNLVDDPRVALPVFELSTDGYARFAPGSASVVSSGRVDILLGVGRDPMPPTRNETWSNIAQETLAFGSWSPSTTTSDAYLYTYLRQTGWHGTWYAYMATVAATTAGPTSLSPALEVSAGAARAPLVAPRSTPASALDDVGDFARFHAVVTGTYSKYLYAQF